MPARSIGLSLVLELSGRKVRTPMQAAIAAGARTRSWSTRRRATPSDDIALRNLWIRSVARFLPAERRMIFPVIGEVPNESGLLERPVRLHPGTTASASCSLDFSHQPAQPSGLPQIQQRDRWCR